MGPLALNLARIRAISSLVRKKGMKRYEARNIVEEIDDSVFEAAVMSVATAKGLTTLEFGDGAILDKLIAFLNEHWDEIFALILKLIGMM